MFLILLNIKVLEFFNLPFKDLKALKKENNLEEVGIIAMLFHATQNSKIQNDSKE